MFKLLRRKLDEGICFEVVSPSILSEYSLPPMIANHYSINTMYNQKILALANRTETQARDVFDLYWLILSKRNELKNTETKKVISCAQDNAMTLRFEEFKGQVLAYLPQEDKNQYDDKGLWENIVTQVVDTLGEV